MLRHFISLFSHLQQVFVKVFMFSLSWCVIFCILNGAILQVRYCSGNESIEPSFIVNTEYGKVQGIKVKNHNQFRGIPYAKPPLGDLRFKPPEKPISWEGKEPLLVNKFPEYCIQFNVFWNTTEGQLTKAIDNFAGRLLIPECFHSHFEYEETRGISCNDPGGFMFGRGSQFRGEYLMEMENVVVVTFHYRLGSFGFLNTGDKESLGNMGLKDQVLALKWVRDNIINFGGDPLNICIFGTSAGAASVHYLLLSEMSKGLFHRAISSSGTALCPWAFQPNPVKNARQLAKLLDCPHADTKKLVECLREKDALEIAIAHSEFISWYTDPISAFSPSVETILEGDDGNHFLVEEPANIIKSGRISNPVPWIVGFNSQEGHDHSFGIVRNPDLLKELNENWLRIFPSTFEYNKKADSIKDDISKRIRKFYFNEKPVSQESLENLTNAYSDTAFVHCAVQSALWHSQIGENHPVYLYKFTYKGQHSILNLRGVSNPEIDANHMDDLQFTMNSILYPFLEETHPDKDFQKRYLKMLTSFAKTGKVTPLVNNYNTQDDLAPLKPSDGIKWYRIDNDAKMEKCSDEFSQRMKFWDEIHDHNYKFLQLSNGNKDEL